MAEKQLSLGYNPSRLRTLGFYLIFSRFGFLLFLVIILLWLSKSGAADVPEWLPLLPLAAIGLNFVHLLLNFWLGGRRFFQYYQLLTDLAFVSALVFYSGGVNSNFVFLYYALIIACSVVMADFSSLVFASTGTVLIALKTAITWLQVGVPENLTITIALLLAQASGLHLVAVFSWFLTRDLARMKVYNDEILENISDAIVVIAANGRIAFLNPSARILLALREKDLKRKFEEVFSRPGLLSLRDAIEDNSKGSFEIDIEPVKGWMLPVNVRVSPIGGRIGGSGGKIILLEDLTIRRRMHEIESRTRRLQEYSLISAGVAHEIRNPLASIRSASQQISVEVLDGDLASLAEVITKESDRLDSILSDFLHMTRMRTPTLVPVFLKMICCNVRATILASTPQVTYEINVPDDLEITLDKEQFTQVMLNLSLNSLQSNDEPITITISAAKVNYIDFLQRHKGLWHGTISQFRSGIEITHEDDGAGIPEEARDNIFLPFYTTKVKGTGLGLAMVQRIIGAHNGLILADYERKKGVAFKIWLPIISASEAL